VIDDDDANAIDKFLASARNTVQDISPAAAKQDAFCSFTKAQLQQEPAEENEKRHLEF